MANQRNLPAGQGSSKNVYLNWHGNGRQATAYTILKKSLDLAMPSNWPVMVARTVNAQLKLRDSPALTAHIDIAAHVPSSLVLSGRHQVFGAEAERLHDDYLYRAALLVAVNRYDRLLQSTLGPTRELVLERYERGTTTYVRTNLSISQSVHALCPPLLVDLPGINPAHIKTYLYHRHRLGIKVSCPDDNENPCYCKSRAESLVPAMWITQ